MDEHFGPSGRLAATLPGFEPRAEQAALADAVAEALGTEEHLLAEAGTGTGKSLAYLLPALASGKRVVVATATKALQEQLLTKDVPPPLPARSDARSTSPSSRAGRTTSAAAASTGSTSSAGLFRTDEDAAAYERLRDWIETTETGDRAELDFEPSTTLWAELAVGRRPLRGPPLPESRAASPRRRASGRARPSS